MREGFYGPNLPIRVSNDIDFRKMVITRKDLDSKVVWFDQEMGYTDWFHLSSLETYLIIYEVLPLSQWKTQIQNGIKKEMRCGQWPLKAADEIPFKLHATDRS